MKTRGSLHLLAVATACILWGGSVICTKLSYDSLAPMSLGCLRFSAATAAFFLVLAMRGELAPPPPTVLVPIAFSGFLGTTLYFAAENYGASLTSGATASLVIGSFPAMTLVLESLVDRTRPQPRMALGIALALGGVCLLALAEGGGAGSHELLGIVILVLGGLCWGIYNLMMRSIAGTHSPLVVTAWQTFFGALGFLPLALVEGAPIHGLSATAAMSLAYLVLGCTVAGFSLYNYGFERLSPTVVASLVNLTPVVGLILSALLLGEHISGAQLAGGAIVLAGIALSSWPGEA